MHEIGAAVLFVLRKNVLRHIQSYSNSNIIRNPRDRENPFKPDNRKIFHLNDPDPAVVVYSRKALALDVLKKLTPGTKKKRKLDDVTQDLEFLFNSMISTKLAKNQRGSVHQLADLAVIDIHQIVRRGHRDLLDHLSRYYFGHRYMSVSERWFTDYAPGIISYVTDMWAVFSQFESGFPNMFLVRNDKGVEPVLGETFPPEAFKPHRQTYWLKYMIAEFIGQHQHKRKKTYGDILKVFCGSMNRNEFSTWRPGFYEAHIVQLCLGSLATVSSSCVIEPDRDMFPGAENTSLRMTKRGQSLMNGGRFHVWSFAYLETIVDDPLLPIPEILETAFPTPDLDFNYLAHPDGKIYTEQSKKMVTAKARKVLLFLEVLETALKFEKERYHEVFRRFNHRGTSLTLPDFAKIREGIGKDIERILAPGHSRPGAPPGRLQEARDIIARAKTSTENRRQELSSYFQRLYIQRDA